jgi:hypothetical protein
MMSEINGLSCFDLFYFYFFVFFSCHERLLLPQPRRLGGVVGSRELYPIIFPA